MCGLRADDIRLGFHSVGGEELLDVLYWLVQFEGDVVGDKFFQGVGSGQAVAAAIVRVGRFPFSG